MGESAKHPFTPDRIEKSAFYLYLQTLAGSILGYIYWIVASRLIEPEEIGLIASSLSLTIMLVNLSSLGIPLGVQRLLGRSLSENDIRTFSAYIKSSFFIVSAGVIAVAGGLVMTWYLAGSMFHADILLLSIVLIPQAFFNILRSPFVAMQQTRPLLFVTLAGHGGKITVGVLLMLLGFGVYGAAAGYFVLFIGSALALGAILLHRIYTSVDFTSKTTRREVVSSGMPSWIPGTISSIGSQLGVIAVFGLQGATEAGIYFIAFSIMNFILAIPQSLISALFPALSGKIQDPAKVTSRIIVLASAISLPIMSFVMVFASDVLSIFGEQYISASFILVLLTISIVPYTIHAGIDAYFYARGEYRKATMMGIVSEVPKVILYVLLVPMFSGEGAAYSYVIGVIFGAIVSAAVALKTKTEVNWKVLIMLSLLAATVSYIVYLSSMPWYAGLIVSSIAIPILFTRLKLVTRNEVSELLDAFPISRKLRTKKTAWISKIMFG